MTWLEWLERQERIADTIILVFAIVMLVWMFGDAAIEFARQMQWMPAP